jgi:hypothetical protein
VSITERIRTLITAPHITAPLLANVSEFASITHLRISVTTVIGLWDALASFHNLRHLDWHHYGSDASVAPGEAAILSLPKLERLTFHENDRFRAFSLLDAPLLRHLELYAYALADPEHWAWVDPVRFPNLQTLRYGTRDYNMRRIVAAIEGHPKLRNVCWEIPITLMSKSIRALSSILSEAVSVPHPSPPLLHQLDRFSIIPYDCTSHLKSEDAGIVLQLAKFGVLWYALPAESRPKFKLCLDRKLVKASPEISRVVERYPGVFFRDDHPLE